MLSGPDTASEKQEFELTVIDGITGKLLADATIPALDEHGNRGQ
jgi:hypothetical protein